MYLKKVRLTNIKCFAELEIDFGKDDGVRLWTTLFGKNGLGKSTLLQAMGAMLAGPSAVRELLQVAEGQTGWLTCGYGPFRRLSGGSEASNSIVSGERRAARFVTLFKEDAALTNATKWLTDLHNTARDGDETDERILATVKKAIAEK